MSLAEKKCVPCRGGVPPMEWPKVQELLYQLKSGWHVNSQGHLERAYSFPDFVRALEFANKIGAIAEVEGHHPDLHVSWGNCKVEIWTHKINGLTESDFYLAAKADRALETMSNPPL
jgi:4a-hydroxytetrahydrobiopterin dehydratase